MSGFNGTPGPWKAQLARSGSNRLQVSNPSGRQVCALWRHGPAETEANRNLITAAPDLLEALEDLVLMYGHRGGVDPTSDALLPADQQPEEVRNAMAAIAKATGGAA